MNGSITRQATSRARSRANGSAMSVEEKGHLELRLWLRLIGCSSKMENVLSQRLRKEFKTSMARFDVLAQLESFLRMARRHEEWVVSILGELTAEAQSELLQNLTLLHRNLDLHVKS